MADPVILENSKEPVAGLQMALERLRSLQQAVDNKASHFFEASKYCPAPWSANLAAISDTFMFMANDIAETLAELEAILDHGGNNILDDVKCP